MAFRVESSGLRFYASGFRVSDSALKSLYLFCFSLVVVVFCIVNRVIVLLLASYLRVLVTFRCFIAVVVFYVYRVTNYFRQLHIKRRMRKENTI